MEIMLSTIRCLQTLQMVKGGHLMQPASDPQHLQPRETQHCSSMQTIRLGRLFRLEKIPTTSPSCHRHRHVCPSSRQTKAGQLSRRRPSIPLPPFHLLGFIFRNRTVTKRSRSFSLSSCTSVDGRIYPSKLDDRCLPMLQLRNGR